MAPVVHALQSASPTIETVVCVTAQHREMLDQVLQLFAITPQYDLNLMQPGQTLAGLTSAILTGLQPVLAAERPDLVLVHGDTTTTLSASLAAFYAGVPVGHVEAGLRSDNLRAPFPEEANRRLTSTLTALHFAPTEAARSNLLRDGVPASTIFVTGNTVIDALQTAVEKLEESSALQIQFDQQFAFLQPTRRMVLVTGHRRENFGVGLENICHALVDIARQAPDVDVVYPVHMNPQVREPVQAVLGAARCSNIHLIAPVDYLPFVYLMRRAHFVITDSGGIQEEAPALGKPVLVMRDTTERPEAIAAGTAKLVGASRQRIAQAALKLLLSPTAYAEMAQARNPYGDGHAAQRIVQAVLSQYAGPTNVLNPT